MDMYTFARWMPKWSVILSRYLAKSTYANAANIAYEKWNETRSQENSFGTAKTNNAAGGYSNLKPLYGIR